MWPDDTIPSWHTYCVKCFAGQRSWVPHYVTDFQAAFAFAVKCHEKTYLPDKPSFICEIEYVGKLPFFPGWFQHWTHRANRTDSQIINDFQKYVFWIDQINSRLPRKNIGNASHPMWVNQYALQTMGAEDMWRWHGESESDPPPCHCQYCQGEIVRINH